MLVDLDLIFDDIIGYGFYHKTEVKAVIGDKVKCMDDEVIEFYEDVECSVHEYDDIIILQKKESASELKEFKEYLIAENLNHLIEKVDEKVEIAKREGYFISYMAICNDEALDVYSFSL